LGSRSIDLHQRRLDTIARKTKTPKCKMEVATKGTHAYDYMKKEGVTAYFDPHATPPQIWYKEGSSNYVLNHEYYHYEEFCKIGKDEFIKGANKPKTSFEWHENNILREGYVYEKIMENKHLFSLDELRHAKDYYIKQLRKAMKCNIDISKIKIIKSKTK
jgi:hypothetical protein